VNTALVADTVALPGVDCILPLDWLLVAGVRAVPGVLLDTGLLMVGMAAAVGWASPGTPPISVIGVDSVAVGAGIGPDPLPADSPPRDEPPDAGEVATGRIPVKAGTVTATGAVNPQLVGQVVL
jgi:hypothetical protein